MPDFASLQKSFAETLIGSDDPASEAALFSGTREQVRRRLALYRGNIQANAGKALCSAYPVCRQLVGDDFFSGLTRAYAERVPSQSGDLNEYGDAFAGFLEAFAPVAPLPYLPDVARLEWQAHRAHYAADAPRFDPAVVAGWSEPQFAARRARLAPSCAVVSSGWPIVRLWTLHQPDYRGDFAVDLEGGGEHALVYRPAFRVQVAMVSRGAAAFLDACLLGRSVAAAHDDALRSDPAFRLDALLPGWIADAVVVDFVEWVDGTSISLTPGPAGSRQGLP